jgi:hypothetical protein
MCADYDCAEPHKVVQWTVSLSFSDSSDRKGLLLQNKHSVLVSTVQIVDKKDELEEPYLVCTVLK